LDEPLWRKEAYVSKGNKYGSMNYWPIGDDARYLADFVDGIRLAPGAF
jgi:hypothetical protein